uniref:Putative transposase n=1 Tax=termite gut metagenome TaxID=433724 RepID=S0DGK3_9ZZZZ
MKQKRLPGYSERKHLRRRGILKYRRGDNRPIHPERTIHERPELIDTRVRIGDWEGDTVLGGPGKGGLVTAIKRRSRYLEMGLIANKEASTAEQVMCNMLAGTVPVLSVTLDNGSEFANFRQIEQTLEAPIYFADPHSPWQRESNENVNGLIRFFFPKGTDFRAVSHEQVERVLHLINHRPRKCLGWLFPIEFLNCCS